MGLTEALAAIKARWKLVAVTAVIGAVVAIAASFAMTPLYQADANVVLIEQLPDYIAAKVPGLSSNPARAVKAHAVMMGSDHTLSLVADDLGMDLLVLKENVEVTADNQASVVTVSAKAPSKEEALEIASTVVAVYRGVYEENVRKLLDTAEEASKAQLDESWNRVRSTTPSAAADGTDLNLQLSSPAGYGAYDVYSLELSKIRVARENLSNMLIMLDPTITNDGFPVEPQKKLIAVLGLVLGLVVGWVAALVLEYSGKSRAS